MSKNKPSINLITTKANPCLKPKQLHLEFTRGTDNLALTPSQQIIERANDINRWVTSPISQQNLQQVNEHLMSHFSKIQSQDGVYNNYLFYKEKIEKALSRSAENMNRFSVNVSQRKNDGGIDVFPLPCNPLERLRKNKFVGRNIKTLASDSELPLRENLFTFDEEHVNCDISEHSIVTSVQSRQSVVDNKDSQYKNHMNIMNQLKDQNILLKVQNEQLQEINMKHKSEYSKLNESYRQSLSEINELQQKLGGQEGYQSQINAILQENKNIQRQKLELEVILKEILLQNEKDKQRKNNDISKSMLRNRKMSIECSQDYQQSPLSKLMTNFSNDNQNSFDLSHSSVPKHDDIRQRNSYSNFQFPYSAFQDSWISASFHNNSRDYQETNTQLICQFNELDIQNKKKTHSKSSQGKIRTNKSLKEVPKRFSMKNKENKQTCN